MADRAMSYYPPGAAGSYKGQRAICLQASRPVFLGLLLRTHIHTIYMYLYIYIFICVCVDTHVPTHSLFPEDSNSCMHLLIYFISLMRS